MINFLDAKNSAFLEDLNRIQSRADRAQRELSTGLRMNSISDDPDQIGVLLQARAELAATQQTKANLGRAKTEVDAAEIALQNGVKAMERVRVLGSQALTGTATAESRVLIAGEVESLLRQVVSISNTAIDGRFIFAGSADQAPPYAVDLTSPSGAAPYAGGAATRQIRDASGVRLSIAQTGQDIFDFSTPSRNVFQAITILRSALLANDEAAVGSALTDVGTAIGHLNEKLSYYGFAQNHVAEATSAADTKILGLKTQIANTEGADLADSILALQAANTHRQAALQAKAQEDRRTVLDFIR